MSLLGFTGFRKVPINLEKNLNFKIAEFKRNQFRAERSFNIRRHKNR